MNTLLPDHFKCSPELRTQIERKLRALQDLENVVPLVFIVLDVRDDAVVYISERGLNYLGKDLEFVRGLGADYHHYFFNPEDADFYFPKFKEHVIDPAKKDDWFSFFQQVKTSEAGDFEWYLTAIRPYVFNEAGEPILSLAFATLLHEHHHLTQKIERLMEENLMLKERQSQFLSLTRREREVLKHISKGLSIPEVAALLFTSELTIRTHRRNIKKKINAKGEYDMIRFAQSFNLV